MMCKLIRTKRQCHRSIENIDPDSNKAHPGIIQMGFTVVWVIRYYSRPVVSSESCFRICFCFRNIILCVDGYGLGIRDLCIPIQIFIDSHQIKFRLCVRDNRDHPHQ